MLPSGRIKTSTKKPVKKRTLKRDFDYQLVINLHHTVLKILRGDSSFISKGNGEMRIFDQSLSEYVSEVGKGKLDPEFLRQLKQMQEISWRTILWTTSASMHTGNLKDTVRESLIDKLEKLYSLYLAQHDITNKALVTQVVPSSEITLDSLWNDFNDWCSSITSPKPEPLTPTQQLCNFQYTFAFLTSDIARYLLLIDDNPIFPMSRNLMLVSKSMYQLFQPCFQDSALNPLMVAISKADHQEIAQRIKKYPAVLFKADHQEIAQRIKKYPAVLFKEMSAGRWMGLSPLTLALKLRDHHTCKIFADSIGDNQEQMGWFVAAHELMKNAVIDLNPVFQAYDAYNEAYQAYQADLKKSDDEFDIEDENTACIELNQLFVGLGKAQCQFLPRHMLKEMGRGSNGCGMHWVTYNKGEKIELFISNPPQQLLLSSRWITEKNKTDQEEDLLKFLDSLNIEGINFAFIRAPRYASYSSCMYAWGVAEKDNAATIVLNRHQAFSIEDDAKIIKHLWKVKGTMIDALAEGMKNKLEQRSKVNAGL